MKIFKNALLFGFMFISTLTVFSQSKVTGTVIDGEFNQPLAGASVVVKGTTTGTATDFDGKFEITTSFHGLFSGGKFSTKPSQIYTNY